MRCREIRCQLAHYRELSVSEREQLQAHLSVCPECTAALAAYRAQDRALVSMPQVTPSARLRAVVRARTRGQRSARGYAVRSGPRPATLRWGLMIAMVLLLLLVGLPSGTVLASGALPGDLLYPYKRAGEQVRLALLVVRPQAREAYREMLIEQRRAEVRRLLGLPRVVSVRFDGHVEALNPGGVWLIEGISVSVPARAWVGELPTVGSLVAVDARLVRGQVVALRVRPSTARAKLTPWAVPGRSGRIGGASFSATGTTQEPSYAAWRDADPPYDRTPGLRQSPAISVTPAWAPWPGPTGTPGVFHRPRTAGVDVYPAPSLPGTPGGPRPAPSARSRGVPRMRFPPAQSQPR